MIVMNFLRERNKKIMLFLEFKKVSYILSASNFVKEIQVINYKLRSLENKVNISI